LVSAAGWDEAAKRSALLTGLSTDLKQACIARDGPDDYDLLFEVLKATNNKIGALASELRGFCCPSWHTNPLADSPTSRSNVIPHAEQHTSNPNYHGPASIELGAGGYYCLTFEEQNEQMHCGLCIATSALIAPLVYQIVP
jgi:hypothetical protein